MKKTILNQWSRYVGIRFWTFYPVITYKKFGDWILRLLNESTNTLSTIIINIKWTLRICILNIVSVTDVNNKYNSSYLFVFILFYLKTI